MLQETLAGDLHAFAEVVARFQDMAFGCAYSILGDAQDAQDAAQHAFISAYKNLKCLRDLERFPAWFKRLVVTACRDLERRRPSPTVPLDEARQHASPTADPAALAEQTEIKTAAREAIRSLSAPNRAATVLFYINGYSVREIAQFLEVPEGTVKHRLHDSRNELKRRMIGLVKDYLDEQRPPDTFRQEVLNRIRHWERFGGSEKEKADMVETDSDWRRLVELELQLGPMSDEAKAIRHQIASLEPCHEHYVENVRSILQMIGPMKPAQILDCGQGCPGRQQQAAAYLEALQVWRDADALPEGADGYSREVFDLLGRRTSPKLALVEHLIGKLGNNDYRVYADEDEDFHTTESRIQHLQICNYNWPENLRIVLREIAAGKRLFGWHVPEGYNAHGDSPDRIPQLRDLMAAVAAWADGKPDHAGEWGRTLGASTPEKRWLAASLCKHVSVQHAKHGGERLLAKPAFVQHDPPEAA